jgi:predicted acyl esterase
MVGQKGEIRDGMRIDWDVPIEMDDSRVLRADVFRPFNEGQYPVILSHGPYAKGLHFEDGYPDEWRIMWQRCPDAIQRSTNKYANWEVVDPEKWVPYGYSCVRVDSRGAGRSPGYLQHFSPRETRDFYLCIEWAGTQPWSNGKVGLSGISYYAMNQWLVASLQPPHLAAFCPWEGAADWYRDATRHGGILSTFWSNWYEHQVKTVQYGLGEVGPRNRVTGELVCGDETLSQEELERNRSNFGAEIRSHPVIDSYYRERLPDWSRISAPFLSAGNWGGSGLHLRGNSEGYVLAGSTQKWLEMHGSDHWTQYYADSGRELQKRFFDYFLKGDDNDWHEQPRAQLNIRHVDGSFALRYEDEWPIARTQWTKLHLHINDLSMKLDQAQTEESIEYDPLEEGITFRTAPFREETEITGPVSATIYLSSATSDADLFLILHLLDPKGKPITFQGSLDPHTPLANGWLRASHRKLDERLSTSYRPYHPHDEERPLAPGEIYRLDIELWPTCIVVPPDYSIGLTIQGHDYEYGVPTRLGWCEMMGVGPFKHDDPSDRPRDRFGGRVTLFAGKERSAFVVLPIIPPPT